MLSSIRFRIPNSELLIWANWSCRCKVKLTINLVQAEVLRRAAVGGVVVERSERVTAPERVASRDEVARGERGESGSGGSSAGGANTGGRSGISSARRL